MSPARERAESCDRCGGELPGLEAIYHRTRAFCSKRCETPVFKVGDGARYCFINDVYPATIRKISKSGHMIWISSDRVAKGHFDESFGPRADLYEPMDVNPTQWRCFTRRADGYYREKGSTSPVLHEGRDLNQPREI